MNQNKKSKKGCLISFLAVLGVVVIFGVSCVLAYSVHSQTQEEYGAYGQWSESDVFDIEDYPYITIEGDTVKIMQLADPQIKFGSFTQDTKTMTLIENALNIEQPDIVVCTGDLTLSIDTYNAYKYFADFMEQRGQYWTLAYGNHDAEFDCSKYTLWKLLSGYEYCLFDCGPTNISGESNFVINVKRGDEYVYSLIMLDSNMYETVEVNGETKEDYSWIKPDQVAWYNWVVDGLKSVNPLIRSSAFWHIPTIEFAKLYYAIDTDRAVLDGIDMSQIGVVSDVSGYIFENDKSGNDVLDDGYTLGVYYGAENIGENKPSGSESDIFAAIKDGGITEAIFCGHDHVNTLRGFYDGIYLCYGRASGYHTYPFFQTENWFTKLIGQNDDIMWNESLRVDEYGKIMTRGVSIIEVDFDEGGFTITDHDATYYELLNRDF
ncbi:MAG TPA: metallophosphoesterase [Clostridia bacterium]|nr:metallophosphoesterase [Clostridia bacterium]